MDIRQRAEFLNNGINNVINNVISLMVSVMLRTKFQLLMYSRGTTYIKQIATNAIRGYSPYEIPGWVLRGIPAYRI